MNQSESRVRRSPKRESSSAAASEPRSPKTDSNKKTRKSNVMFSFALLAAIATILCCSISFIGFETSKKNKKNQRNPLRGLNREEKQKHLLAEKLAAKQRLMEKREKRKQEMIERKKMLEKPEPNLQCNIKPVFKMQGEPTEVQVSGQQSNKTTIMHNANYDPGYTPFFKTFACDGRRSSLQQHQKDNGNYNLGLFYHMGMLRNWVDIVCDQLATVDKCGLGDSISHLSVSYSNGPKENVEKLLNQFDSLSNISVTGTAPTLEKEIMETRSEPWEAPVMRSMSNYCSDAVASDKSKKTIVFYLHNKGTSRYKDDWRERMTNTYSYLYALNWRKYMEYFTTQNPVWCIDAILNKGAKTCGVKMRFAGRELWEYSGNFWVASCDYIASLPPIALEERDKYAAETWLGTYMGNMTELNRTEFVTLHEPTQDLLYETVILPEDYVLPDGITPSPLLDLDVETKIE